MPSATPSSALGELWEQCLQWLRSAGVLDPREQFIRLADFAALLRNGVLLCELALRLKPDSIDRHEILIQYQQSPFTCSKNIGLFLNACREHFGIEHQLFDEEDLYGLQNFGAVLRLLSQLSRTQTSRQLGLKPFPEETTLPSVLDNAEEEDNTIYSNLRDEVEQCEQHDVVVNYSRLNLGNSGTSATGDGTNAAASTAAAQDEHQRHKEEEDGQKIYDTICGQAVVPQKGSKTLPISYAEFKPTTKREFCLKELLDKDINYTNALRRIENIFYARMHFHLNAEDLATIFINIREILRLSISFVAKLEPAVLHALNLADSRRNTANFGTGIVDMPPLSVAELFIIYKERFTIYGLYCSQLTKSTCRINELERNDPEFKRIVTNLAKDEQFRLQTLLILPFQHITKYQLLLNDLAKYTTDDLAEQSALNTAREAMKDVCEYLNEMKRDQEIIEYITTITRSISGLDLRLLDYGRLMAHDYVKLVNQNGSAQRYLFLFEKMMMFCKRGKDGVYKKKEHLLLDDIELVENELEQNHVAPKYNQTLTRKLTNSLFDNTSLTLARRGGGAGGGTLHTAPGQNHNAEVVQQQQQQSQMAHLLATTPQQLQLNTFQLVFKSLKQRDEWRDVLWKAIETYNPRAAHTKGHSLFFKTYNGVTICAICKMLLRGQFFQGYHCSGCNRDMHRECACLKECTLLAQQQNNDTHNGTGTGSTSSSSCCSNGGGTYQRYRTKRASMSSITRNFFAGETVVVRHPSAAITTNCSAAGTSSSASSPARLSWQNGDLVELLELNMTDGTAIGRLKQQPQFIGIISLDSVAKFATTLDQRTLPRHSRASSCSLNDVIPFQNPSPQIIISNTEHQSPNVPNLFVTNAIVDFHKNNPNVVEQPWYFGVMDRAESRRLLYGTADGTFLVRWSAEVQKYALSISVDGSVKHMRLEYNAEMKKYHLNDMRFFDTMLDLINYFRVNNLSEAIHGLDVVLRGTPLKGTLYRAVAPFERTNGRAGYITLRPGDLVTLLDTADDDKGWWRGSVSNANGGTRVGYFPATYVQLVQNQQHQQQQQQLNTVQQQQPQPIQYHQQKQQQLSTAQNDNSNADTVSMVYQNGFSSLQQQQCNGNGTAHEEAKVSTL
ncbi:hypothetical protein niasHS_005470 [Heterodera schachtii]|uniref:Guanine nucleotide exchange factor VAV2 n=1 Tax=Heterodera schachtii TaxID=97005 RepID=A0ABD2JIV9_HETSC